MGIGTKKTVIMCDYIEVERLINDTFFDGKNRYEMVLAEEADGHSSITLQIFGKSSEKEVQLMIEKGLRDDFNSYTKYVAMEELCKRGLIEAGEYVIDMSW